MNTAIAHVQRRTILPTVNLLIAVAAIVIAVIALMVIPTTASSPRVQTSHVQSQQSPSVVTAPVVDCGGRRPVTMC
jgi:hypothetical protein